MFDSFPAAKFLMQEDSEVSFDHKLISHVQSYNQDEEMKL